MADDENIGPSPEARAAVTQAIAVIEGLNPQDRGYLLNRLTQIYFGAKGAKQVRGALKSAKTAKKKPKTSWKKEWEATEAYKAWQAHIDANRGRSPEDRASSAEEYNALRQEAFRVRDTLKPSSNDKRSGEGDQDAEK